MGIQRLDAADSKVTKVTIFGCGSLALEVCQYILDCNRASQQLVPVISVTRILSSSLDRYEEICKLLGSEPEICTKFDEVENWRDTKFVVCVGDAAARQTVFRDLKAHGAEFISVIHPLSYVAESAQVGAGAILAPFVFIGPGASIGENCILNVSSSVGHDGKMGRSSVLSPKVAINGGASIGDATFVGAGTVLDPRVKIGDYCKIASGSVVKGSFPSGFLLIGSPAAGRQMFKVPT